MNKSFSIREALSYGWNTFKTNWKFLVLLFIGLTILQLVFSYLTDPKFGPLTDGASGVVSLISFIVSFFIGAGLVQISLKIYNKEKVEYRHIISRGKDAWRYFLGSLLMILVFLPTMIPLFVGAAIMGYSAMSSGQPYLIPQMSGIVIFLFVLSLILIIYFSTMFSFWGLSLFDRNIKVVESLKHSARITKGYRGKLFLFAIVLVGLNIIGFICLLVGLLVTISITLLAQVWVYKKLNMLYMTKKDSIVPTPVPVKEHTEVVEQPKEIPSHTENSN